MANNETNIYLKLQQVRVAMNEKKLKKSGKNEYAHFEYYELGDFLPEANKEFLKVGLVPVFNIEVEYENFGDVQYERETKATLTIYDEKGASILFTSPIAEVRMGKEDKRNPIQELGATHTYMKRYLYANVLELADNDVIDATIGKDEVKEEKKATEKQIELIKKLYEQHDKILEHYQIEKFEDLTISQASELIQKGKERNEQQA